MAMTIALLSGSLVLSALWFNFGAKLAYQSDDFQAKHQNGIRIVDFVEGRRGDIYGDDSAILPHPYLLYVNRPNFSANGFLQHDGSGYRIVPQPERPPGLKPKKVLVLGGSTTYSYPYILNPAYAWPSVLQQLLGPGFQVINAGLSSATTAELLAGYIFRHRYLKPDIVIVHEGGNDVMAMMHPHYNPEYSHLRAAASRPTPGSLDRGILRWGGWPAKLLYASNWNEQATVFVPAPTSGLPAPPEAMDSALHAPTQGFERNLSLLVRNIQEDGAVPVLFGFVQAKEENLSRNRPDMVGREHAFTIALHRNLRIMQRIAADHDLIYLDPEKFQTKDEWFLDNCHLNEEGEAAKAKFVVERLQAILYPAEN